MKKYQYLRTPTLSDLDPSLANALQQLFPELRPYDRLEGRIEDSDERIVGLKKLIGRFGQVLHTNSLVVDTGLFTLKQGHEVEAEDAECCSYLRLETSTGWPDSERTPGGLLQVPVAQGGVFPKRCLPTDGIIGLAPQLVVCDPGLVAALRDAELRGVVLKPTQAFDTLSDPGDPPMGSWEELGLDPYYELTSDLVLPPLNPKIHARKPAGVDPATGVRTYSGWVMSQSELFPKVGYHYRAEDLSAVGPFDLARTCEPLLGGREEDPGDMIFSQRVRSICASCGFDQEWWPVWIDEKDRVPGDSEDVREGKG